MKDGLLTRRSVRLLLRQRCEEQEVFDPFAGQRGCLGGGAGAGEITGTLERFGV